MRVLLYWSLFVLCVFVGVGDIKSGYEEKPSHPCQTFRIFDDLLHKTQQGAAGTKVPLLDKFRLIILLSKVEH